MNTISKRDRVEGSVFGLAYGDAWGYPQEFKQWSQIQNQFIPFPDDALVSDDTQMSLYVIAATLADREKALPRLASYQDASAVSDYRVEVAEMLLVWLHDIDNNRAPGMTCVGSLHAFEAAPHVTGLEGANDWSKGNGANIRAPWLGLLDTKYSNSLIGLLSAVQASTTHNHPLALAAAAITSLIVRGIVSGDLVITGKGEAYKYAREMAGELLNSTYRNWLPENYAAGLQDLLGYLYLAESKLHRFNQAAEDSDVCALLGEGWVAEEALLVSIALLDKYAPTTPLAAVYRAANSSGDSDSIAAITGAFVGAAAGIQAFPSDWKNNLEERYLIDLNETVDLLTRD